MKWGEARAGPGRGEAEGLGEVGGTRLERQRGKEFLACWKPAALSKATETECCPVFWGVSALEVASFYLAGNVSGGFFCFGFEVANVNSPSKRSCGSSVRCAVREK